MLFNKFMFVLAVFSFPAFTVSAESGIFADLTLRHGDNILGTVRIELDAERAPRPVANFIGLATGQFPWINPANGMLMIDTPFYDGLIFHRLIHDFMIQGGDPMGTGRSGPGYIFQDQFNPDLRNQRYRISMAHSGPCTNGSQFFILLTDAPWLDDYHSVFGVINDPADRAIIDAFTDAETFATGANDRPLTDIIIESIVIGGNGLADFDIFDPSLGLPRIRGVYSTLERSIDDQGKNRVRIQWPADYLREYPISLTGDLHNWGTINNYYLIMNDDQNVSLTAPVPEPNNGLFFRVAAVDYSSVPQAPVEIFREGAVLAMNVGGGLLTVTFGSGNNGDLGAWTFTAADNMVTSGTIAELATGRDNPSTLPVLPDGMNYLIDFSGALRYLSLRDIYLLFAQPVGPDNMMDIEALISFHTSHSGWFLGDYTQKQSTYNIDGAFTWTPPE